ncbi:hypothetical protein JCM1841_002153 [Sporobolomyces salmonicolor]
MASPSAHRVAFRTLLCESDPDFQRCLAIRIAVFVDEQRFSLEDELDDKDATADHLLLVATNGDGTEEDAGTIRWWPKPGKREGKMGRVALHKKFRGGGTGKLLVMALEEHLRSRRGKGGIASTGRSNLLSIAHSQAYAQGFYERAGYVREGDLFLEDGADHVRMVKEIQLEPEEP